MVRDVLIRTFFSPFFFFLPLFVINSFKGEKVTLVCSTIFPGNIQQMSQTAG
jgi:hypothetical protein